MLIIGFVLLIVGADLLVKSSSNIAKKFNIPEILIGLTIISIGTSMPELIITIFSANSSSTDLIIGNAIGSNICNLLLILGIVSVIRPIKVDKETKFVHLPVALLSTIVILFFAIGILGDSHNNINRIDGIILVALYLVYFLYPIVTEIKDMKKAVEKNKKNNKKTRSIFTSFIGLVIGIIALKYGGDLVVDKATEIATVYGVPERIIGLTIVAIGTALPELITSIIAVINKEEGLAVGNLIGSCILNSFLILGIGAIITPLAFSEEFIYNLLLLTFSLSIIIAFCFIGKKNTINRYEGGILLILFILYMVKLFV